MGFVTRWIGNGKAGGAATAASTVTAESVTDGAIDTLCCVLRTMGEVAFNLDDGAPPEQLAVRCDALARHVENGADVPELGIEAGRGGARDWGQVRRFYVDRRRLEADFVGGRMTACRDMIDELIAGLRDLGQRDTDTAVCVQRNLNAINEAVVRGSLPEIRSTLSETLQNVADRFAEQKRAYERRIGELNDRMNALRQSLTAVREEMKRDTLTGAYNRGAFDTALAQSLNLNFILNQPVTVVFVDLDHFKQINDTYGHAAGDQVLRSVGDCLARSFIRKTDFVARFGGDEFAAILSDTTAANSAVLLKRFFEHVAAITVPCADDGVRVACSAGYTEIVAGDSLEALVKRVDEALYEAKKDGRNCFRYAAPPAPADGWRQPASCS